VYVGRSAPDEARKSAGSPPVAPEPAAVHDIGRTADDERPGAHPVGRDRRVRANEVAVPPLADPRVGVSSVPRRNPRDVASGRHSHPGPEVG
jgi:hypothetical protein